MATLNKTDVHGFELCIDCDKPANWNEERLNGRKVHLRSPFRIIRTIKGKIAIHDYCLARRQNAQPKNPSN